jgi:uncharacterized protein YecE (DUF72 family)
LPENLYLGTSSWAFPGWAGLVYDRVASQEILAHEGLAAYAAHPLLRAVGIDRTYYAPLPAADFDAYRQAVPEGFRFLVKAHQLCTLPFVRSGPAEKNRSKKNPLFLDSGYAADEVVRPFMEGLREKAGVLVFQFSPLQAASVGGPDEFVQRLERFLGLLPRGPLYAVELRSPALATPPYFQALGGLGAAHCFNVHPTMPGLARQERLAQSAPSERFPALVVRWMLRRDQGYEGARDRFSPFDRLVEEDAEARSTIARMALEAVRAGRPAFVIANNKAEGSAPLTIFRLAEELARPGR